MFFRALDGSRVLVLVEGRDASGKSTAVAELVEYFGARSRVRARSVALSKPSACERRQWYFARYLDHLPRRGEVVVFDRSWYNRALVERVMGFCTSGQVEDFFGPVPALEALLVASGIVLIKIFLRVD